MKSFLEKIPEEIRNEILQKVERLFEAGEESAIATVDGNVWSPKRLTAAEFHAKVGLKDPDAMLLVVQKSGSIAVSSYRDRHPKEAIAGTVVETAEEVAQEETPTITVKRLASKIESKKANLKTAKANLLILINNRDNQKKLDQISKDEALKDARDRLATAEATRDQATGAAKKKAATSVDAIVNEIQLLEAEVWENLPKAHSLVKDVEYQQAVVSDLEDYLDLLTEKLETAKAQL